MKTDKEVKNKISECKYIIRVYDSEIYKANLKKDHFEVQRITYLRDIYEAQLEALNWFLKEGKQPDEPQEQEETPDEETPKDYNQYLLSKKELKRSIDKLKE